MYSIWIILIKSHFNFESNLFIIDLGHNIPRPLTVYGLNVECIFPKRTYLRLNRSWNQTKANFHLWSLKILLTSGLLLDQDQYFYYQRKMKIACKTEVSHVSWMPKSSVFHHFIQAYEVWLPEKVFLIEWAWYILCPFSPRNQYDGC